LQTAAASLRVTAGSAAGGLLFNVAVVTGASFVLIAGLGARMIHASLAKDEQADTKPTRHSF